MKVKFRKYRVSIKGRPYCILIPHNIEQLWLNNYGKVVYGTFWDGNRAALEAIMYSCAVLGFDPNKIIYFPVRNNPAAGIYLDGEAWRGGCYADPYDMIFMSHHIQFPRCRWKRAKQMMAAQKPQTYILDYRTQRTEQYFRESVRKAEKTAAYYRKEQQLEELRGNNLFYIFSRMQFRQLYLDLSEFLQRDWERTLEQEDGAKYGIPFQPMTFHERYRHPSSRKACSSVELGFYDRKYDEP